MSSIIECIRTVGRGERSRKPLNYSQAYQVMKEYLRGEVGEDQMAMLMMLIRVQNETVEEVSGFAKALREHLREESKPELAQLNADIDWPCFAGKRQLQGQPWHLYSAHALAKAGYKVLLHGHVEAESKRHHAEHYLDKLNIVRCDSIEQAHHELETNNIAYLPLTVYAPQVVDMLRWQQKFGLRTPTNTAARMLNPANAAISLRGSFHPGFPQLHGEAEGFLLEQSGDTSSCTVSFKGVGGETEYNPKVSQTIWRATHQGTEELYWDEQLIEGLPQPEKCALGTSDDNMALMINTAVSGIALALWAKGHYSQLSREQAIEQAIELWKQYCQ